MRLNWETQEQRSVRKSKQEASKRKRLKKWHRRFAFVPTRTEDDNLVWLEFVERKAHYLWNDYGQRRVWVYRRLHAQSGPKSETV